MICITKLGIFLDISKVFNKAWLKGVIHKLKRNGILVIFLRLLTELLRNRTQRVTFKAQSSSRANVNTGVNAKVLY